MFKRLFAILLTLGGTKEPQWKEGALYAVPQEDRTFTVVKILKLDDGGVHVRMYSNVFGSLPSKIDESSLYMAGLDHKPNERLGMGHSPISKKSFATWGAVLVQQSSVSPDELDGYQMWLDGGGGYF